MNQTDNFSDVDSKLSIDVSEVNKVKGLWYRDGNIVLRAGTSFFRVYQGILSHTCRVFDDLFSMGDAHSNELVDNCPVLDLQDPPKEVEDFLRAIFQPNFLPPPPNNVSDCTTVINVLRLAHKYDSSQLRFRALQHLSTMCPTTLTHFENRTKNRTLPEPSLAQLFISGNVFVQTGEDWLIPCVLYDIIVRSEIETIYGGCHDGTHMVKMCPENQHACLQAYPLAASQLRSMISFLHRLPDGGPCSHPSRCSSVRQKYYDAVNRDIRRKSDMPLDPLDYWGSSKYSGEFYNSVCSSCQSSCKAEYQKDRQGLWNSLPNLFGMSMAWKDLEIMKTDALKDPSQE